MDDRALEAHKRTQAALKLKNRTTYRDHGLIFAMEWTHVTTAPAALGMPLRMDRVVNHEFPSLITAAGVRRIKFHGVRHTAASLLVEAGVPIKVVAERLGHTNVMMTLSVYAHVLPGMQKAAADQLGGALNG